MDQKLPEPTKLNTFITPLQSGPEAIPTNIPLSVGVIAMHPPKQVRPAVEEVLFEYGEQKRLTDFYSQAAETHELKAMTEAEKLRSEYTDEIKIIEQLAGETNDIDYLEQLASERTYYTNERETAALNPYVQGIYNTMSTAAIEKFEAEQRALELQADAEVAQDIKKQYKKLGQRGRIGSYVAGVLLAAGSIVGTAAAEAHYPAATQKYEASGFFVAPSISLAGGYLTGSAGRDYFARRRAKRQVKKAQRHAASA